MAAVNKLDWVDNSTNETGFIIERKTEPCSGTGAYAQVGTVGVNIRTYTDSSVVEGNTYCYRVAAVNATGKSAYSNTAERTIPSSLPAAPSNLVITLTIIVGTP